MNHEPQRMTMAQWARYISEQYLARRREQAAMGEINEQQDLLAQQLISILNHREETRTGAAGEGTDTAPKEID
jgi:hypothetical protein